MKALLSIQLVGKPEEVLFQTDHQALVKQHHPEVDQFSLDNFSEGSMVEYALKLIEHSENILLVIESRDKEAHLNKLLKLLNHVSRGGTSDIKFVLFGTHSTVEKMGRALREKFYFQPSKDKFLTIMADLFS